MRRSLTAVIAAAALLLPACGGVSAGTAASVNGDDIPMDTIEQIVARRVDQTQQAQGPLPAEQRASLVEEGQRQALGLLIQATLLRQAAEQEGVSVTAEDVDATVEEQVALLPGGRDELDQRIAQIGLTGEQARRYLFSSIALEQELRESLRGGTEVTEEELRRRYEANRAQYTEVEARHILLETREDAEEVLQQLEDGTAFAELAQQRSTDTQSAPQGGSLGTARAAQFAGPFQEAVLGAEIGETVGPVETQFGWHIIEVQSRETIPFPEARESIADDIRLEAEEQGLQALLGDLFQSADIEVNSRIGRWDPTSSTVVAPEPLVPSSSAPPTPGQPGLPAPGQGPGGQPPPNQPPPNQPPPTPPPTAPPGGQSGS